MKNIISLLCSRITENFTQEGMKIIVLLWIEFIYLFTYLLQSVFEIRKVIILALLLPYKLRIIHENIELILFSDSSVNERVDR